MTMSTIRELQNTVQASGRAARHLLAEKGDRRWSAADQAQFDTYVEAGERALAQIQARERVSSSSAAVWAQERDTLELYIRKAFGAMTPDEKHRVQAAMTTTTGSEGGFAVGTSVAGDLLSLLKGYGWMRQVAADLTTQNGSALGYPTTDGGAEVGEQIGQNAAATPGDMVFGTRPLPTFKFSSKVIPIPIELLQDSAVDVVAMVNQRAVDRIGRIQNQKFTVGTGTGESTGLVTAAGVGKVGTTGQTTTIIYDDLVDLADSVDEAHLGMPSRHVGMPEVTPGWMLSQSMRKVIRKIKDTNGRPIWMPAVGGELPQLLDYPVYINNDMPAPAANAKSVAFGNLRSYMIRDVQAVRLVRMDDSAYTLIGQVAFVAWLRSGGNLLDLNAVKVYQHSAT